MTAKIDTNSYIQANNFTYCEGGNAMNSMESICTLPIIFAGYVNWQKPSHLIMN